MNNDRREFLTELRNSRVRLCKRAACSLGIAWDDQEKHMLHVDKLDIQITELQKEVTQQKQLAAQYRAELDDIDWEEY